ncbi:MAG: chlororespiratory reduction protein 7 [Cyanobacteriota bacterium]|jgi:hypothetical protein|nr:chlororespiratory reduction protein 7 [Cyanobacteriota bacterium]
MPDAIMYQGDAYVVLVPGEPEEFLSAEELLGRLVALLGDRQDNLPPDLRRFPSPGAQAEHLRDTACEFEIRPGETLQWYLVRLEKP